MVVHAARSADEWQEVVSRCFIPINFGSFEPGFTGRMDHLELDDSISISCVATDGHTVDRSERLAAHAEVDDLHLSLQVASRGTVRQGRRMVAVRPGSTSMYATDSPYYLDYSEPGQQQLIVQVSRAALDAPSEAVRGGLNRLTVPASDATRVFFTYALDLHRQGSFTRTSGAQAAAEVAKDLAATMIRASAEGTRVLPRTRGGLLRAIQDFVSVNLPRVRVDDIASEFFLSRRTVYHVFEEVGMTPSDYLRTRRLTVATARLADPALADVSIGEIAVSAGFDDATTFTRAFRREHGMTPREWRAGALAPELPIAS
ncbi:AraC family transcriptional regulator [Demequina capsici]|uniref:AraC family transcriptional regulator n=1 Tax=Demequina capsici TaxID=3075620 RepID=A0AA96F660_9MICO|nr:MULTISPECIES: AraC family transcriptional regulator [unclassified Demequina]WNM24414.1 AraC family transcriptional regulator [Demequina sp. OYTSA14]WNM27248.1 AraC family transcriptional regulator [Demequina sp. PMTSA13]